MTTTATAMTVTMTTTDRRGEPSCRTHVVDAGLGAGRGGPEFRPAVGTTATVPVIPLWERLRAGVRG
ncbi:hypothetical protein [Streptomyces resistomycificus]|uniref:Uncharacterized protein n=1 Tax=Streptomyces resistomycificus TaxID=67356 RepID=A0A0L8L7I4_9ACTN|nr:hypothetical protein [Streptomyces resistomycificus]KOG34085.1 hypothetical protein ADK37_20375 [Streptomyces resistomycificus]KUN92997.1 hypothetical protein AQJ84_30835 [Streptomyces resistomycificus]